jgi:phosphoribosylformimino-5-aminoimidazole carboxamide ribotide isomerase
VILYPAIDLKGGACVRLVQGEMASAVRFNDDPAAQARSFAAAGAEWLHIVDLDGAFDGRSVNGAAVDAILHAVDMPCQLGGGIRDLAAIEHWLSRGIARVILGTVAVKDPDLVARAAGRWPGRVAVAIDARGGRVAVEGWAEQSEVTALALARHCQSVGVAAVIHTDIERDGRLAGPAVAATAALADEVDLPVIASGGIASLEDLVRLRDAPGRGIAGAISGRALYDGRIDLARAIAVCKEPRRC